jgi:hypothetical protein
MRASFYSCWPTMKAATPHRIRAGGGAIVNTGSSLAYRGWKEVPAYVSSKHEPEQLVRTTREVTAAFLTLPRDDFSAAHGCCADKKGPARGRPFLLH